MKMKHIKTEVAPVSGQHYPHIKCTGEETSKAMHSIREAATGVWVADCQKDWSEFIVRACNCHDELVEAINAILTYCQANNLGTQFEPGWGTSVLDRCESALNKATR